MARFTGEGEGRNTNATYQAAAAFRDRCLLADGSLLFGDAPVWTEANLDRLRVKFVDAPDESERSFREKFEDQLKDESQAVKRLASEALAVYFLFPSNVRARKKRELIGEVLGWGGDALPENHPVIEAFAGGIGSGGQGYNTRRPFEIAFLIRLAMAWKKLEPAKAKQLIADAWTFEEFVDGIEDADSRQLRHMLLHLLFPEHFERIASSEHKRRVAQAFAGLLPNPEMEGADRRLYAMRQELSKFLPGKSLDFYWPPLREAWYDSAGEIDVIHHKKQIVLYGPPGTGKTHEAREVAERIIRSAALERWGAAKYFQEQDRVAKAVNDGVHTVQLHPAYSYEDFVRGLHFTGGKTEYRPGVLLQILGQIEAEKPEERLPHVLILDEMNRTDLSRMLGECFSLLENRDRSVRLPGGEDMQLKLPSDLYVIGTMNLIDQSVEQIDFALRRRFLWIECLFNADTLLRVASELWSRKPKTRVSWDRVEDDFRLLASAAAALNHAIHESELLGSQYEVGHTYFFDVVRFLKNELEDGGQRRQGYLWNKKRRPRDGGAVERLWRLSLEPLLREYLSGLRGRERDDELQRLRSVFFSPPEAEE
jgi:5-methylcytosine-specific restriction protein B